MKRAKSATFDNDPKQTIQNQVKSNIECFGEKYRPVNNISDVMEKFSEIFGLKLKPYDFTAAWVDQKSEEMEAFFLLIKESAPYFDLIMKISHTYKYLEEYRSQKRKLTDNAIVKMIENFEKIDRAGRRKKISVCDREDWKLFTETYAGIIEFCFQAESELKSLNDYRRALEAKHILKSDLERCKNEFEFKFGKLNCSDRTLYRQGFKDLIRFRKVIFYLESAIRDYDFYFKS